MSSNFINSWQKHTLGNLKQPTTPCFIIMFLLYLVKTRNISVLNNRQDEIMTTLPRSPVYKQSDVTFDCRYTLQWWSVSTTPLSFDAPFPRNPREYPHTPLIFRN